MYIYYKYKCIIFVSVVLKGNSRTDLFPIQNRDFEQAFVIWKRWLLN